MTDARSEQIDGSADPARTATRPDSNATEGEGQPASVVSDPAKLIRLGTMIQTVMNEVRELPTDESGRRLLARIHAETMDELGSVLSPDLMEELSEFTACCDSDGVPTESEIRVAQAQLVGWLQGLLQGLQASMISQQAAAARQLQELQVARMGPPGANAAGGPVPSPDQTGQTGAYL